MKDEYTLPYYDINSLSLSYRYESADVSELQELLIQTFKKKSKLLEIGCGSGRDASFMVTNNYDVIGIDGSLNMITEAKKLHPELSKSLFHKVIPDELNYKLKFDGIYSIATLMHLSKYNLIKTISIIYDMLNEHGIFLMSVSLLRDDINKEGFDEKGRFFLLLTLEEWINICEVIGFKILNTKINNDGLNRDGIEWLTLVLSK